MRFVANYRYSLKPDLEAKPLQTGADSLQGFRDAKDYISDCKQTMVGFVQKDHGQGMGSMKNHKVQCYVGK